MYICIYVYMYICKYCHKKHKGIYGTGLFCSKYCHAHYSAQKTKEKYKQLRYKNLLKIIKKNDSSTLLKGNLKDYLFEFNIKNKQCEICKRRIWMKKPIPLQLHHKDGNHNNNLLKNLQILCPNCHAQTDTYGLRNMAKKIKKTKRLLLQNKILVK